MTNTTDDDRRRMEPHEEQELRAWFEWLGFDNNELDRVLTAFTGYTTCERPLP